MAVHLTAAQAKKLGIDPDTGSKVRVRATAKGPYHTVCCTCGEEFHTVAAEDRHVAQTFDTVPPRHARYRLVLGH